MKKNIFTICLIMLTVLMVIPLKTDAQGTKTTTEIQPRQANPEEQIFFERPVYKRAPFKAYAVENFYADNYLINDMWSRKYFMEMADSQAIQLCEFMGYYSPASYTVSEHMRRGKAWYFDEEGMLLKGTFEGIQAHTAAVERTYGGYDFTGDSDYGSYYVNKHIPDLPWATFKTLTCSLNPPTDQEDSVDCGR